MLKDSVAQAEEKARLEWMLRRVEDHVARLREERRALAVDSLEWGWVDNALFEARCEARRLRAAIPMAGRRWQCTQCGEVYGPKWVSYYNLRCNAECDGDLVEVA